MGLTKVSYAMINSAPINVLDYGVVGDGTTDDTAAIQSAIDAAAAFGGTVFFPSLPEGSSYKTTGKLVVTAGVQLVGEGWQPITGWNGTTYERGAGSWIYVSEPTEAAISVERDGSTRVSGVIIRDLAFIYDQPTPGSGFTATDSDYCLKFTSADDCKIERVMTLNPGRSLGITGATGATSGRIDVDGLYGQPMYEGIFVDFTADVCRIDNVHFWPYWSEQADVMSYTRTNSWFLTSKRNDNMQGTNWFSYAMNGLKFGLGTLGVTSRIKLSNVEFDNTKRAFWVGSTAAAVTGQIANFSAVADSSTAAADLFISEATDVKFDFSNVRLTNSQDSSVRVSGNNASYKFSNIWCEDWDLSGGAFSAFYCDTGASLFITYPTFTRTSGSTANKYSGAGTINVSRLYKVFTGTLNASGVAIVVHGIGNLVDRLISTQGYLLNAAQYIPLTTLYYDNVNAEYVSSNGAADSGKTYRVVIEYTS